MEHKFFSDGNSRRIAWVIKNQFSKDEQSRDHAEIYFEKISDEQSKYVALHVGIFWGIGRFIIKNGDTVQVMIDSKKMFKHLSENRSSSDSFIEKRINFYNDLVSMRQLEIVYNFVEPKQNLAEKLL